MNKLYLFLFAFLITLQSSSCGIKCENAELCIKNNSADTGFVSFYDDYDHDTLAPGESVCINVGYVEMSSTTEIYSVVPIYTSSGNYMVEVATCHAEYTLE